MSSRSLHDKSLLFLGILLVSTRHFLDIKARAIFASLFILLRIKNFPYVSNHVRELSI
jgi:hypothetical protein